jgi:mannose-6-phosphate isomerase-like protein (cupin superfamily)
MAKRRDFLVMAGLPALSALTATSRASRIPSAVFDAGAAKLTHEPFGDQRIYFAGATDQIQSMTAGSLLLNAGMSPHAPHQHPEEEFMVITEGTGEIVVEGKKTEVGPGSMMYCAANKLHGIVNTGKTPLLFYFYKWKV